MCRPVLWDKLAYCDRYLLTIEFQNDSFYSVKSSVFVTFTYCDNMLRSQQCHNSREGLYYVDMIKA